MGILRVIEPTAIFRAERTDDIVPECVLLAGQDMRSGVGEVCDGPDVLAKLGVELILAPSRISDEESYQAIHGVT